MAAGKEIRGKIKSVENTKKITKAMEMVAASKMRKAQERMRAARPYSEKIRNIAANLGQANPEYVHAFMKSNDAKSAGMIVVTTDKGLCGGMNTNVLRGVTNKLREQQAVGISTQAVAIGNKGLGFLNRIGAKVVSHATQLGDTPHLDKLIGPVKVMLDAFVEGKVDAVYLCYTKFINTMRQEPMVEQLLPLSATRLEQTSAEKAQYSPLPISLMAATLYAVNKGYVDDIEVKKVLAFEHGLHQYLKTSHAALLAKLEADKAMDKDAEAELNAAITSFKKSFA